ncbi:MAG: hypothetical protein ACHREM_27820, partial [Polyangiales bacterium]
SARPRSATLQGISPLGLEDVLAPARVLPLDARPAARTGDVDASAQPASQADQFPPTAEVAAPIAVQAAAIANATGTLPSGEAVEIVAPKSSATRAEEEVVPSTERAPVAPSMTPSLAKTVAISAVVLPASTPPAAPLSPITRPPPVRIDPLASTVQAAAASSEVASARRAGAAALRESSVPKSAQPQSSMPSSSAPEGGLFGWVVLFLLAIAALVGYSFLSKGANDAQVPAPAASASASTPR